MMPLQVCGQALAAAPAPLPLLPGLLNGTSPGESGPDTVAENRGNPARAGLGLDVARRERRIDIPRLKVPLIVKSRPHAPQPSQGRARGDDERTPPLWCGMVKARVIAAPVTGATASQASRVSARRRLLPYNEVIV